MPLPELTRRLVEDKLGAFCQRRLPPHVRDQVRLTFTIRGNAVTLNEERIVISKPGTWVSVPIAQLRFDPQTAEWSLYGADRNGRWHLYIDADPTPNVEALLAEVDSDPTGLFWG